MFDGSQQLAVQLLVLSGSDIRSRGTLHGPGEPYSTWKPLKDEVEFRGYDGSAGSWAITA